MRFMAAWDSGGPDKTTMLNARGFPEAASRVALFYPKATRMELVLVSEADTGGVFRIPFWLRLKSWFRRWLS